MAICKEKFKNLRVLLDKYELLREETLVANHECIEHNDELACDLLKEREKDKEKTKKRLQEKWDEFANKCV